MKSESQSSLEVNREVRRVLVAHWIDIGRLSIHTMKDSVHIRGSLFKLAGSDAQLTTAVMDTVSRKIISVSGGRRVRFEFDNWRLNEATGAWEPTHELEKKFLHATRHAKPGQTTYDVSDSR